MSYQTSRPAGTFSPALNRGAATSRPTADGYAPKDCKRLSGPHPCPTGTPMPIHGIRGLDARLERLAFPNEEDLQRERAPIETYTVTPGEYGDVVRATPEFVSWMRSRVGGYGGDDRVSRASTRGTTREVGEVSGDSLTF